LADIQFAERMIPDYLAKNGQLLQSFAGSSPFFISEIILQLNTFLVSDVYSRKEQ